MFDNPISIGAIRRLTICCLTLAAPVQAAQISLNIADIAAPSFAARDVRVMLPEDGSAELSVGELQVAQKTWRKIHVGCAEFSLNSERMVCRRGRLDAAPELLLDFSFEFEAKHLELSFSAADESWQASGDFRAEPWHIAVQLRNAQGNRLAPLLPPAWPQLSRGTLNGALEAGGGGAGLSVVGADLQLAGLAFADASGLHAAEKLAGKLRLDATRVEQQWDWRGDIDWQGGELFWQPLYLRGGNTLQASGQLQGNLLRVTRAVAGLDGVGEVELAALWDVEKNEFVEGVLSGNNLGLTRLFTDFARPFLGESVLAASELSGRADVAWQYRLGATKELAVKLRDAALQDGQKRFMLKGVNGDIPWHADASSQAELSFSAGAVWGVPVGAAVLRVAMRGLEFAAADAALPVFDGKLELHDFHLRKEGEEWQWDFSGALSPISMPKFSAALGWTEMHGALAGAIPKVSYRNKTLKVDGKLQFFVFDGMAEASHIELFDPFGRAPRFSGDLDMRGLDLDLLTRTFSFGNMQGRMDASVKNLDLVNWQPVRFDARLASSPGSYRKKISQKAVENISALGGAGGAAALQRSYMRIFENFGYDRIALSCVLRDGVCAMDGVERRGDAYVIVKGGGIPAINVIGYNRAVGWNELLNRLKRVMQDNIQAVVK
jgi:hypothetical protein